MASQVTARSAAKKRVEQFEEDGVEDYLYIMALADDEMLDAVELALRNISVGQTLGVDGVDMYGRDL